jgi:hypothetical protein
MNVLRQRDPDQSDRIDAAKDGTAHVLFVWSDRLAVNGMFQAILGTYALAYHHVKRIVLSSGGDRSYPAGRIGD